jgi:hypothetical protein
LRLNIYIIVGKNYDSLTTQALVNFSLPTFIGFILNT